VRDLSVTTIAPLDTLSHDSVPAFGAKTGNVAELRKILPREMVPNGFGIPFHFYDRFMKENGLYDEARALLADASFQADPASRATKLETFQEKIKNAPLPTDLAQELETLQTRFPAGTPIRCRSSSNTEDLEGFNGTGLYESCTHPAGAGDLSRTVKQIWASVWSLRAVETRDVQRLDHCSIAMGVLLHPHSDEGPAQTVLTPDQLKQLAPALERIQEHFKDVYGRAPDDEQFAMDIAFGIDASGKLVLRRARPRREAQAADVSGPERGPPASR
jgi:hypothetical protein